MSGYKVFRLLWSVLNRQNEAESTVNSKQLAICTLTDLVEDLAELVDALAHGHRAVLAVVEHGPDGAAHALHVHGSHLPSLIRNFQFLKFEFDTDKISGN